MSFPSGELAKTIPFPCEVVYMALYASTNGSGTLRHPRGRRWRHLPWLVAAAALSFLLVEQGGRGFSLKRPETLENCAVVKVHDGDTLHVLCRRHADQPRKLKIRLHCIDAPELAQTPWGREARDHLRTFIGKGPITIQIVDKDKYRRSVAEITKNAENANLEMVKTGKAAVYWRHCKSLTYGLAQWQARSAHAGIWRQTGLHQTPWEYRH